MTQRTEQFELNFILLGRKALNLLPNLTILFFRCK